MALNLSNVVSLTIAVEDFSPKVSDFGTMAIFGKHSNSPTPLTYAATADGLAQMVTEGFSAGGFDPIYNAAAKIAGTTPAVATFKVYNRTGAVAEPEYTFTPTVTTEGRVYQLTINGNAIQYEVQNGDTATDIATALHALANALTGVDSTDNTGTFTLNATTAGDRLVFTNRSAFLTLAESTTLTTDVADVATALSAGVALDSDFYGFILADSTEPDVLNAAASWAQSNKRLFLGFTFDDDNASAAESAVGTDLMNVMKLAGYDYAGAMYGRNTDFPHAAIMARQLSRSVGSSTWNRKRLSGVVANALTEGESDNIENKNGWVYALYEGSGGLVQGGRGASGRPFDITRGVDWLQANMQADVVTVIANSEKVPYTLNGIAMIESAVRARLKIAEDAGFIDSGWTVSVPALSGIPTADKVARVLNNVTFTAQAQGAIEKVTIAGRLKI